MEVCLALSDGNREEGRGLILREYPFDPWARPREVSTKARSPVQKVLDAREETKTFWTEDHATKMRVFARDGFINRFTGELLVFPAALRLLSREFPKEMPYQQAWRVGEVHLAYYDLYACANKVVALSRGGKEDGSNLITTTMPYILARSDSTVEEVGWRLTREGYVDEWDGMSSWYVEYVKEHPELRNENYFNMWFNAAKSVLEL